MSHTTTRAPAPPTDRPAPPARSRTVVVGWLLVACGVLAAGVLLLVTTAPGPAPEPAPEPNGSLVDVPRNPDISERWLAHHSEVLAGGATSVQPGAYAGWPAGVPHSADAAERWFASQHQVPAGWPKGAHKSADAADRWFANQG